ncbi:alpha/beta-hydrolase [Pluteus cervinus]|uniref:Alpha/beta-hydrolase n=1 Tax=Pluteus cervinus TaxID=181527 RepID=A0ACD3BE95_9AGAR|nr:alpha/beta-hydrolase [Pluteus cervinus]
MLRVEDKTLSLPDGRTLAYADNGNTSSTTVVLFLHGAFGVGDASRPPTFLLERSVHYVAPSLPGWGRSSPASKLASYSITLSADIATLLTHLHPQHDIAKLYICAHSFGTIHAQMLCEVSDEVFPFARQIAAMILLAPQSPPHRHADYAKCMSWQGYFMAGPPARYMPFNLLGRLVKVAIAGSFRSDKSAEAFVRNTVFDIFAEEEKEAFAQWKEDYGVDEGQYEKELGKTLSRSVLHSWQGFLDIPSIYHFGWGRTAAGQPCDFKAPVLIVSSTEDHLAPAAMAKWLSSYYPAAKLKIIKGGHLASFFLMDEIWKEVFDWSSG